MDASQQSDEEQIKLALANSLSLNEHQRAQSLSFLQAHLDPNPGAQLSLLNIIARNHVLAGASTAEAQMLQYQAILYMKNSLSRLFQDQRNKKMFKQNGHPQFNEALKEQIKQQLLDLLQAPDGLIHTEKAYEQLTLVAAILVHYDFPANWPQLNQWLLTTFDKLFQSLGSLQIEQVPLIKRFLKFYLEVMGAQNKKKLNISKGQFHKVARDHLRAVYQVWLFFNQQQSQMLLDPAGRLTLELFNQDIFELASKLDKCLQLVIACGFSLHDLLGEPQNNQFVRTTQQLIEKVQFFTNCVDKLSQQEGGQVQRRFYDLFQKQIKCLLKLMIDLQYAEPLIVFDSLGLYIEILAHILFKGSQHNERVKKLALFGLYRIVSLDMYNQSAAEKHYSDVGILVSPSKFKNFEPQVQEARNQYQFVFEKPDPASPDPRVANRKDGAREILKLIFQYYLPLGENIKSWQTDPENFIELEDENYFIPEFDIDSACSLNFLAHQLLEKMLTQMQSTCYPFVKDELLTQYFAGQLQLPSEVIEDALLCIIGMLAKLQQKLPADKRLDIMPVLSYLKQRKFSSPLFKRRYTHLLTMWIKIIPKTSLMEQFGVLVQSLAELTDHVLIYEHCRCIHEMIKEIDYWVKKSGDGGPRKSSAYGSLFDHSSCPASEEEDQISQSVLLHSSLDFTQLFGVIASKTIPMLSHFQAPTLIWNIINYITLLLEKNSESNQIMTECFRALNLQHLLQLDSKLIDEAIIDMLKNLFALQGASPVILDMCIAILDFKLAKKPDFMLLQLWLFTIRATATENTSLPNLKPLFQKYSYLADLKKDFLAVEFLKIVQEYVLLDMYTSEEELLALINYMHTKFLQEVELEKQIMANKTQVEQSGSGDDSEELPDTNIYEKKYHILTVVHLILQKGQANPSALQVVLGALREFLSTLCSYFVQFKPLKNMPSSSLFYTQALAFINRAIVVNREFFVNQVLQTVGIPFASFVESWFNKMELILSQDCRRINMLAIYTLLPFFSGELLQHTFGEIGRMTFSQLESFLHMRSLENGDSRFTSPTKIGSGASHYSSISTKVKINMFEKSSNRAETLKKQDSILDIDVLEFFAQKMTETKQALNIQPSLELLVQFIANENHRVQYLQLLQGLNLEIPAPPLYNHHSL